MTHVLRIDEMASLTKGKSLKDILEYNMIVQLQWFKPRKHTQYGIFFKEDEFYHPALFTEDFFLLTGNGDSYLEITDFDDDLCYIDNNNNWVGSITKIWYPMDSVIQQVWHDRCLKKKYIEEMIRGKRVWDNNFNESIEQLKLFWKR